MAEIKNTAKYPTIDCAEKRLKTLTFPMKRLYPDYGFFSRRPRERVGGLGLLALLIVAIVLLVGLSGAYYFRRNISDAWRQWRVASIPSSTTDIPKITIGQSPEQPVAPDEQPYTDNIDVPVIEPPTELPEPEPKAEPTEPEELPPTPAIPSQVEPPPGPDVLPERVNLNVPIVYQAPLNVWDDKHDDACEEASILMVQSFLLGHVSLTRQEMEDKIMALIDYQMDALGYFESTNAELTAQIMREYLDFERVAVLPVNSIDDIRRQLAAGRPVIIPADGKALKNPNFRGDGPVYHMFVAKGYTETHIIVHDPGTRRGANWMYTNEIVMESLADWVPEDHNVDHSKRYMIVVW